MLRIGVLVSGGGTNLQAIIDRVENGQLKNVEIGLVISNKEDAYALERASKYNIPTKCLAPKTFENKEAFNQELIKTLKDASIDLVVLAGFLVVLDKEVIQTFENRIINVHPSLIPAFSGKGFYGLKVHEAALERGVQYTGATVHFVDEGTDTGPIIMQKVVKVLQEDTPSTLQKRVMEEAEWEIMPQAIQMIANNEIIIEGNRVITKGNTKEEAK
ncbi:formyltetrahydrofolate-dependent phosphoribosylglycinamide formyltransferase [Natranaerovirga pectinivora]|uniref:Phosphoribosylglycinamide formyltransferase n=1 Tax=Natranaerovirga pectinivora TaxID=682400 RepID=A0A4V2V089_9FIRM|nr:phosphoribosylglycinamide formyltransferase [Natranaerovirga pectinivora]TCT14703.1 formyltetrahydrofolate-dependent phosphoribosylglycinamide formyltransferase [Natranaerovirga pectinivora]